MYLFQIFWQIHDLLNLIHFSHFINMIWRALRSVFLRLLCVVSIGQVEDRYRYIIFPKIQRKLWDSTLILSIWIVIFELNNIVIYIEILKGCLLFHRKSVTVLEAGNFSLIFFAHSLKVLSNHLGSSRNDAFISFAQLANQSNIKSTCLVLIVILCIGVVGILYWIEVILVDILMLFEKLLDLLCVCAW